MNAAKNAPSPNSPDVPSAVSSDVAATNGSGTSEHILRRADGNELYWEGHVADNERAVVLLLHGLGEHLGRYRHLFAVLNEAGYSVFAVDHRGHGKSTGKRGFVRTYDEFMDDIRAFHTEIVEPRREERPLIVLGHSMGGNLAMGYALRFPDRIDGLALSGPLLAPGEEANAISLMAVKLLAGVAPGLGVQSLDAKAVSRDPKVVDDYQNDPLVYRGKVSAGIGNALLSELRTFPDRYRELRMPVLVMHGTADRLTNPDGSRQLEVGATETTVTAHFYDGLYHEIFNEPEQEAVFADLVAWLNTVVER